MGRGCTLGWKLFEILPFTDLKWLKIISVACIVANVNHYTLISVSRFLTRKTSTSHFAMNTEELKYEAKICRKILRPNGRL